MATDNTTEPATWLELKCSKYTPDETLDWVLSAWSKTVKPEFAKFRKAIADQTADIPPAFFETKGAAHGNRNPLFLFLRPKKLLYIALASAQGKASQKKQNSLEKILTDYRIEWDSSLTELQTRLNHISAVSQSRHLIQQLCEQIYCLGDIGGINSDWHDRYKNHYLQACEAFGDIPWQAEKEKHDAKNLREQIKIALGRAPEEKPKPRKRASSEEKAIVRFKNRPDLLEHFKASVAMSPIALSFYAIGLGVDCNQKKSYFNMAGLPKSLTISKNATLVWTVIRALVSRSNTDKQGFVELFKGWYGPFASKDPNSGKAILRRFICPLNATKSNYYTNYCRYHLSSAKQG